ncbi:hypothetical protein [Streptomyces hygroscopicus]|uniref:hypothetical protein n=1 Tax=Streptomyces hygroscopicus TaxID=1912 RepID=UPI001FCB9B9D|nr:hypothetical protein [Streptomyces hygroscopicus]BDH10066.1 hypothetical protein HOK021_12450 [Streptomyces hygroscopicus]
MLQSYPQADCSGKAACDVMTSPGSQVGDDMIVDPSSPVIGEDGHALGVVVLTR